jgi:hypothetical protein
MAILPGGRLISGGGDPFLILWNYETKARLQTVPFCTEETGVAEGSCVTNLALHGSTLAVTIEGYKYLIQLQQGPYL